jgi:hypothetical protein
MGLCEMRHSMKQSHGETLLSQQHLLQKSVEDSLGLYRLDQESKDSHRPVILSQNIDVGAKDNDVEIKKVLGKMRPAGRKMI